MEKCLKVQFPNGDIFLVPARIIAENRANYYAEIDGYEIYSNEWNAEVDYAMDDDFEIHDWISNNMTWPDLEPYAQRIDDEDNYDDDELEDNWSDAEIEFCD